MLVLKDRKGRPILDWNDWTPPKKPSVQWKPGRSAMALAQAWFSGPSPTCPPVLNQILLGRPETAGIELTEGWPEYVTPLPERGEGRNHDLLLLGHNAADRVVISIEAKVDEPFGAEIGYYWYHANQSQAPTRAPERMQALLAMVFGSVALPDAEPWSGLRYQLLTMIAGAAIEAARRRADTAVCVVHEFRTALWSANLGEFNDRDFDNFMSVLLSQRNFRVVPGCLYGPVVLAAGPHLPQPITLFVGKVAS